MIWLLLGGIPFAVLFLLALAAEPGVVAAIMGIWLVIAGAVSSMVYGLIELGVIHA